MAHKEFNNYANLLFDKEKKVLTSFLEEYRKKFEAKKIKFDYCFHTKRQFKKTRKIDLELVCEIYPLDLNKNKSIKTYEYRNYKFVLFSCDVTNQNKISVLSWSRKLLKFVLCCQLCLVGCCKMTKENIFDFVFKLFLKNNTNRFADEFRGKNIEIIRFIIIDALPLLFVSSLIIAFIIDNPDASYWSLIG